MKPVNYKHANSVLKAPEGATDVIDLPIARVEYTDGTKAVESCWELSDDELQEVIENKKVFFLCQGMTHPPILLQSKSVLD